MEGRVVGLCREKFESKGPEGPMHRSRGGPMRPEAGLSSGGKNVVLEGLLGGLGWEGGLGASLSLSRVLYVLQGLIRPT